jgi:hypothetical protein
MNNKQCYVCNDLLVVGNNWAECNVKEHKFICLPCHKRTKRESNFKRAAMLLPNGIVTDVRHMSKKAFLDKNPGAQIVGKFDNREIFLDDFVKSIGLTSVATMQALSVTHKKKEPKTADQIAYEITTRVENSKQDRTILKKAKKKPLKSTVLNIDGTTAQWFTDLCDSATRCAVTDLAFEPDGPFQKSPDQIVAGEGYTEENTRIVILMYNWAKNKFTDADVRKMCVAVYNKIEEESSGRSEQPNSLSALV